MIKYTSPSIHKRTFNCPHCNVLTQQNWFAVYAQSMPKNKVPIDPRLSGYPGKDQTIPRPFFRTVEEVPVKCGVDNIWFSQCYHCNNISLWIYNRLFYPQHGKAPPVNSDTPEDIRQDYEEASSILDLSPRGAAALIRLCIQKLCKELGQSGKNINDDIGALVKGGLDPRVQQALDFVRLIGNEAVHPGQIDLRDDRATAETLFKLFNLIVEKTISEPKHIAEVYGSLPPDKLSAIEKRDNKNKNRNHR